MPLEETLAAIAELQQAGLVRHVGVSNFNAEQLRQALGVFPVVCNQINYNALNRSPERQMLPFCRGKKISVVAHSSLVKGILSGRYSADHKFSPDDERSCFAGYSGDLFASYLKVVEELKNMADTEGKTMAHAAVAWLLAREEVSCVLVGPKSLPQLEESTGVIEALTPARRVELRRSLSDILDASGLPPLCPFASQLV